MSDYYFARLRREAELLARTGWALVQEDEPAAPERDPDEESMDDWFSDAENCREDDSAGDSEVYRKAFEGFTMKLTLHDNGITIYEMVGPEGDREQLPIGLDESLESAIPLMEEAAGRPRLGASFSRNELDCLERILKTVRAERGACEVRVGGLRALRIGTIDAEMRVLVKTAADGRDGEKKLRRLVRGAVKNWRRDFGPICVELVPEAWLAQETVLSEGWRRALDLDRVLSDAKEQVERPYPIVKFAVEPFGLTGMGKVASALDRMAEDRRIASWRPLRAADRNRQFFFVEFLTEEDATEAFRLLPNAKALGSMAATQGGARDGAITFSEIG